MVAEQRRVVIFAKGSAHRDGDGGRGRASRRCHGSIFAGTTVDKELLGLGVDDVDVGAVDGIAVSARKEAGISIYGCVV